MDECEVCDRPASYLLHLEHADPESLTNGQRKALLIYKDVTGRRGIGNEFECIDDGITEEILREWEWLIDS